MASQGVTASNSRLAQMKMRIQQKQLQEREQRRLELTQEVEGFAENGNSVKPVANGRVRQMFDERRRGAGIDRANPLKPINAPKSKPMTVTRSSGAGTFPSPISQSTTKLRTVTSNGNVPSSVTAQKRITEKRLPNGNYETIVKDMSSLSLGANITRNDRNNNQNSTTRGQSANSLKLKPVVTKKSPTTAAAKTRPTYASPASSDPVARTTTAKPLPPKKPSSGNTSASTASTRQHTNIPDGASACRFCNRIFNLERLSKHEQICEKTTVKKRKIFDATRHRLRGTDAEKYHKKSPTGKSAANKQPKVSATPANSASGDQKKSNWRQKHEEFIQAIRAAKQVQAHLARGGKLSDLPPPPPSENPDYIQCPHCLRRFNQSAAERHIPRCANMLHNKPKPGQATKRR